MCQQFTSVYNLVLMPCSTLVVGLRLSVRTSEIKHCSFLARLLDTKKGMCTKEGPKIKVASALGTISSSGECVHDCHCAQPQICGPYRDACHLMGEPAAKPREAVTGACAPSLVGAAAQPVVPLSASSAAIAEHASAGGCSAAEVRPCHA